MAPADGGQAASPWLQRLLLLLPFVGIVGVFVYDGFSWCRYARTQASFDSLKQGTCVMNASDYHTPLLPLKEYFSYPLLGTFGVPHSAWTRVPCKVDLEVFDAQGSSVPVGKHRTLVYFTYWQHYVVDVIHDTCYFLVPEQAKAGHFACSYELNPQGAVDQGVFIGSLEELPKYPQLFLAKATGLSLCTLGPIAIIMCLCARGAIRRRTAAAREAETTLASKSDEPLLAGA
uniref:Uncharacterized protein n=2 Tax=Alexandrium andersonii TaxID=327968 RepID=A0A7S2MNK3_9DINO|mmetsp:Transcript_72703/g.162776  ORF Transcript_72703/g.162776 Transcript_72703/m.162776 type:complete len:231 (+) Transcript_72703:60-752(+)